MKIIMVDKCEDCPYFEYACTTDNFLFVCEHIDVYRKGINDKGIVQEWCPLSEGGNDVGELITNRHS